MPYIIGQTQYGLEGGLDGLYILAKGELKQYHRADVQEKPPCLKLRCTEKKLYFEYVHYLEVSIFSSYFLEDPVGSDCTVSQHHQISIAG